MVSSRTHQKYNVGRILSNIFIIQYALNAIDIVSGDRGSFIGCYRQNLYLRRLEIFSGSVDVCVESCEHLFFR